MKAALLQAAGLLGLPIGGLMVADAGGALCGLSISLIYVGLAVELR